jgi:hypothetical protein
MLVQQSEKAGGFLQLLARRVSSAAVGTSALGVSVKKTIVVAAFLAAAAQQPGWAASKSSANCYTQNAIEAEQAIRFMTDVMVASSVCQNTTYAEFRLRNRDAIVAYQKALIAHFRGNAGFDRWNTSLANAAAEKHGGMPSQQFCDQSAPMFQRASGLDPQSFRAYAASQATASRDHYAVCGKKK